MKKREAMPPRAAAYLEIAAMRERVFTMMFERTGDAQKAVDEAYVAMCFIEEGSADLALEAPAPRSSSAPESVPERERLPPFTEEQVADIVGGVKIGHTVYKASEIERFKELWASPDSTGAEMEACLGVSWMTIQKVAQRLDLGPRGKRAPFRGGAGAAADTSHAISIDDAIDWYEAHENGLPVIPSGRFPGSYVLGEEGSSAVVTRNALIAEINALRRKCGLEAFTINLNGA